MNFYYDVIHLVGKLIVVSVPPKHRARVHVHPLPQGNFSIVKYEYNVINITASFMTDFLLRTYYWLILITTVL